MDGPDVMVTSPCAFDGRRQRRLVMRHPFGNWCVFSTHEHSFAFVGLYLMAVLLVSNSSIAEPPRELDASRKSSSTEKRLDTVFIEDFSTTTYRDDAATTADWSTTRESLTFGLPDEERIFGTWVHPPVGYSISNEQRNTLALAVGDVDNDGDLDVISGDYMQTNRLYLNDGNPINGFNGVIGIDLSGDTRQTWAVALGDVDRDGDLDLVEGSADAPLTLYLNNGDGSFASGSSLSAEARNTRALNLVDINGDGDLDIVVGNWLETNQLYRNQGQGVFDPPEDISPDTYRTAALAVGDVDQDGDLDVVSGNGYCGVDGATEINRLYLNRGNGTFDSGLDISDHELRTTSIALADLDNDGRLDVIAGHYESTKPTTIYFNNGKDNPFLGSRGYPVIEGSDNETWSIAVADHDGDGDLDVFLGQAAGTTSEGAKYCANHGDGYFTCLWEAATVLYWPRTLLLADMDGNGGLDLVHSQGSTSGARANVFFKDVSPSKNPYYYDRSFAVYSDSGASDHGIATADLDGDGLSDFISIRYDARSTWYRNDGDEYPNQYYLTDGT